MTRILVIDDDAAVRKTLSVILSANGFGIVEAENGKAGIEAITAGSFDVVIVDLFMPDMDGMATIKAIRECSPATPIIAASGFLFERECPPMPNFGMMAAEAGAVSALYKPFRPKELLQAIQQALASVPARTD